MSIRTPPANNNYRKGWDKIFGSQIKPKTSTKIPEMNDYWDAPSHQAHIQKLIELGKKIGKVPRSASMVYQISAFWALYECGITEYETYEEEVERLKKENEIG